MSAVSVLLRKAVPDRTRTHFLRGYNVVDQPQSESLPLSSSSHKFQALLFLMLEARCKNLLAPIRTPSPGKESVTIRVGQSRSHRVPQSPLVAASRIKLNTYRHTAAVSTWQGSLFRALRRKQAVGNAWTRGVSARVREDAMLKHVGTLVCLPQEKGCFAELRAML